MQKRRSFSLELKAKIAIGIPELVQVKTLEPVQKGLAKLIVRGLSKVKDQYTNSTLKYKLRILGSDNGSCLHEPPDSLFRYARSI